MIGNVSQRTGWVRVVLSFACAGALAWALYSLLGHHRSAYLNLRSMDPTYFYAIVIGLCVTSVAVLIGLISGFAGIRRPGDAPGWIFNVVLVALLTTTVWSADTALGYIAYAD